VSEEKYRGIIQKYKRFLPVSDKTPVITLNEGNTPLIYANYLSKLIGKGVEVYLKYEGLNPTGSFKDRGMIQGLRRESYCGNLRFYRKHFCV
jgi:threonine synthase